MQAPFALGTVQRVVQTSIGIAVAQSAGVDAEELMRAADQALYQHHNDGHS